MSCPVFEILLLHLLFSHCSAAQISPTTPIDPKLVGTWTSKSGQVLTGSNFYDPWNETIFEPNVTGIAYSFTIDGYYEESRYQAIANPTQPRCLGAIIQWQHGVFLPSPNGSLHLQPYSSDGRQQLSRPCQGDFSTFTRYNQPETFINYQRSVDTYYDRERLDLFQWDGTPENPMWLAHRPPDMLPTTVLHPQATKAAAQTDPRRASDTSKVRSKSKRVVERDWDLLQMVLKIPWLRILFCLGIVTAVVGSMLMFFF